MHLPADRAAGVGSAQRRARRADPGQRAIAVGADQRARARGRAQGALLRQRAPRRAMRAPAPKARSNFVAPEFDNAWARRHSRRRLGDADGHQTRLPARSHPDDARMSHPSRSTRTERRRTVEPAAWPTPTVAELFDLPFNDLLSRPGGAPRASRAQRRAAVHAAVDQDRRLSGGLRLLPAERALRHRRRSRAR